MAEKKLKITLVRSIIGAVPKNKATALAMGLRKINKSVILPDNEATKGQIQRIRHLIKVEEVEIQSEQ
ncbi:MAG: 50S ribosomal protein L30 [Clostridium sp.]|jgi:large subunit ribosomal protein L30|nr:50S ribosomal protein L30 [Clostridium sp.]